MMVCPHASANQTPLLFPLQPVQIAWGIKDPKHDCHYIPNHAIKVKDNFFYVKHSIFDWARNLIHTKSWTQNLKFEG